MISRVAMLCLHTNPLDQPGSGSSGGMNVYVRWLARALAEAGVEVDVFTRSPGRQSITADAPGVRIIALPAGGRGAVDKDDLASLAPACAAAIERFALHHDLKYDLLHSHYWISGLAGIELARAWNVPHVHMFHTLSRLKTRFAGTAADPVRAAGEQRVIDDVDAVVTANSVEALQMRESYRLRGTRTVVIPCGIELPSLEPARLSPQERDSRTFAVVALGRAERLKNFELLIRGVAEAARSDPAFAAAIRVRIAGGPSSSEPEILPELRDLAAQLGLADRVDFLGPVSHDAVGALYAGADVCVVPSRYESFGLVAVEAMSCGLPVIAGRVGGLMLTVEDGVNGFLVAPDDPAMLAERLLHLYRDPSLRAAMGDAGKITAQQYAWHTIADRMLCLYQSLRGVDELATA